MPLARVGTWTSGGTPSKAVPAYWGGSIPWATPRDMKVFELESTTDSVTKAGAEAGLKILPMGSILIVVRGMILAHTFPVCITTKAMAFNQDIKAVIPGAEISGRLLAYWFTANKDRMLRIVTEATHGTKRIDWDDLHRQYFTKPHPEEQARIVAGLSTHDSCIRTEAARVAKLRLLRTGLMEDLLTGRVRVTPFLDSIL